MKYRRVVAIAAGIALMCSLSPAGAQDHWVSYAEVGSLFQDLETAYPSICERHDLGLSVNGRHIWALRITDNLGVEEDEPEFKYISTMHGHEPHGTTMLMKLADLLVSEYGSDGRLTDIVDEMDVWIVPLMNPDGYDRVSPIRYNANGVDLNRDFPDPYTSPNNTTAGRAEETAVIMNWSFGESFTLSANMHTGAIVANYPFDNNSAGASVYTASPDDDLFIYISEEYTQHNPSMWNSTIFTHGITNGADWYAISGGMQDWSYCYMGCNEITLELSNDQFVPPDSQVATYWNNNRESMLAYMETCWLGIRGIVTDGATGDPLAATITVAGRDHEVYTDPDVGDYHRMLLPGTYDLTVTASGYAPMTLTNVVVNSGDATVRDIQMFAGPEITFPNGGETLTEGVPTNVTWTGNPVVQFHVQYTGNYGDVGLTTDDFERTSLGADYTLGGDANWATSTSDSYTGARSAKAGTMTHNQSCWMTRMVNDGDLSFYYHVDSEDDYDWFNFYINGTRKVHASGTTGGWTLYTDTLTGGGPHELKWEYTKDYSVSNGSDTVWIDDLSVTADNVIWTDIVNLSAAGASSAAWTPPDNPGTNYKVRVRSYDSGAYSDWDDSDAVFTVEEDPGCVPGDVDIATFVDMLLSPESYTPEQLCPADVNEDTYINGNDIQPYVILIIEG